MCGRRTAWSPLSWRHCFFLCSEVTRSTQQYCDLKWLKLYRVRFLDLHSSNHVTKKPAAILFKIWQKLLYLQVGAIAGADYRGKLVTVCCAVNAVGNALPWVHFKSHCIQVGPVGCIGTSYRSRRMTAESFLMFIEHFVKQVGIAKVTFSIFAQLLCVVMFYKKIKC